MIARTLGGKRRQSLMVDGGAGFCMAGVSPERRGGGIRRGLEKKLREKDLFLFLTFFFF